MQSLPKSQRLLPHFDAIIKKIFPQRCGESAAEDKFTPVDGAKLSAILEKNERRSGTTSVNQMATAYPFYQTLPKLNAIR